MAQSQCAGSDSGGGSHANAALTAVVLLGLLDEETTVTSSLHSLGRLDTQPETLILLRDDTLPAVYSLESLSRSPAARPHAETSDRQTQRINRPQL